MEHCSFPDLCAGFCEIAGVAAPDLAADHTGLSAFHLELRDVTINVVHSPMTIPEHIFVLLECGVLPDQQELRAMRKLLEANFFPLQVHPPTFGRNPVTGDIVLQFVYPLSHATPNGLHDLVSSGIDLALVSRQCHFLVDESPGDMASTDEQATAFGKFA